MDFPLPAAKSGPPEGPPPQAHGPLPQAQLPFPGKQKHFSIGAVAGRSIVASEAFRLFCQN
jgi:hypothetical protein